MGSAPDLLCSLALIALTAGLVLALAAAGAGAEVGGAFTEASLRALGKRVLGPTARRLVAAGISANMVTAFSLGLGLGSAVLLGAGRFGVASVLMVLASLGDAMDGLVARESRKATAGGALFDASVDRYEESALLGALAIYFRDQVALMALALLALLGSYMVSYGSAKAEALRVRVPGGIMRRGARAACLCVGCTLVPVSGWVATRYGLAAWVGTAPVVLSLAAMAGLGNISAILRLRVIAMAGSIPQSTLASPPRGHDEGAATATSPQAVSPVDSQPAPVRVVEADA